MKFAIANHNKVKERQLCKYKRENSKLKKKLRELKEILGKISNLVQHFSVVQPIAQSHIGSELLLSSRKLPSNRLNYHMHRLSSNLVNFIPSHNSIESFISMEISSIEAINHTSTMNSSFVVSNLSNENEVCIDHNPVCGWVSPTDSDGDSSIYFTPKSSAQAAEEPLVFYDADDSYDADAEMSTVLMHGDRQMSSSETPNESNPLLSQSQSVAHSMDFSIQPPCYVTQQSSDVFSNFSEILSNETNNNIVPLPSFHNLKVQQQKALQNSSILQNDSIAAANLMQQHTDVVVNQNNNSQFPNESSLSLDERSQFEYQPDESRVLDEDHALPAAKADVTEEAQALFPKYPHTFGSSLNTSSVFNYRSPNGNEIRDNEANHQSHSECASASASFVGNESGNSRYDDSIGGDLLELAKDLSSSSSMFDDSIECEPVSRYENVFNTAFMQQAIDYFAQENACEFSIDEYLPRELLDAEQRDNSCSCCLCQLREKNGSALDVCIRKHPNAMPCQRLQTRSSVCDSCLESMVLISKRTKDKQYQCIAGSCQELFKKLSSLHSHYLKHLKCKMYFCSFCSKSYNTIRGLRTHERGHAN